ncbi:UNVERIFIED_CONTAM: WRKY transcription factor 22 [Sesamum radiatum]|uniref:WRKY transcription factor 22 n=1 Tax=Sesamum radiatum TaxID=300843 RepID=A0AAW2KTB7_SESRA
MQHLKRLYGKKTSRAEQIRPGNVHRHLHSRAQPPMPTHRNSIAGSTRQKPAETPNSSDDSKKPSGSPPAATSSPVPEKVESSREELCEADQEDDEDDGFSAGNMAVDDDFFAGLENFTGGECVSDNFPGNFEFPWLASSATTTAAGGG